MSFQDESTASNEFEEEGIPDLEGAPPGQVRDTYDEGLVVPEDVPLGVEEFGTTAAEDQRGETLAQRADREVPDVLEEVARNDEAADEATTLAPAPVSATAGGVDLQDLTLDTDAVVDDELAAADDLVAAGALDEDLLLDDDPLALGPLDADVEPGGLVAGQLDDDLEGGPDQTLSSVPDGGYDEDIDDPVDADLYRATGSGALLDAPIGVGRLVEDESGVDELDTTAETVATDTGVDSGGFTAEEAAMHVTDNP